MGDYVLKHKQNKSFANPLTTVKRYFIVDFSSGIINYKKSKGATESKIVASFHVSFKVKKENLKKCNQNSRQRSLFINFHVEKMK